MIRNLSRINWLSVLLALFFYSFLGWLWFTVLFNDEYALALDKLGLLPAKPDPIYFYGPPITILPTLIPHPVAYGLIVGGFHLVGITVSCLIMGVMRKK